MIKIALITFLLFAAKSGLTQSGSWTIKLDGKTILATGTENEKLNVRKITNKSWKGKGKLEIRFRENEPATWRRSFLLVDENENQLLSKDSVTYTSIRIAALRKLFSGKKQVRIFTVVAPLDPTIAIRMRRLHLCTLQLP
jgi:hypothetical protein